MSSLYGAALRYVALFWKIAEGNVKWSMMSFVQLEVEGEMRAAALAVTTCWYSV